MKKLLTVAGSDCSGGAGIQADLRVFRDLGFYGMSVITAVTAQNTLGVRHVHPVPAESVAAQLDAIAVDIGCDGLKSGMLVDAAIIRLVAEFVRQNDCRNLVIDPVIRSSSGRALLNSHGIAELRTNLLPLAFVVTPNLAEAEALAGNPVNTIQDMREAAQRIFDSGVRNVIIKGGHLPGDATDILYDGRDFFTLEAARLDRRHTHGTGCTFSAALTANIVAGKGIFEAFESAKEYTRRAIDGGLELGKGTGPAYVPSS